MCNLVEIRLSCEFDSWFRPERFVFNKFNNKSVHNIDTTTLRRYIPTFAPTNFVTLGYIWLHLRPYDIKGL
jgi:hypothetical protein